MKHLIAVGLALVLGACGGQSSNDGSGGSAGTGPGGSGGGGGSSGGVGGSSGTGAVSGSGGALGGSGGGDACHDPTLKTCNGPGQCVLATSDCCLCGVPELTDYVAMNQASAGQCNCQGPICDCAMMMNPNLAASCESGQCAAWDVRLREDYAGCKLDSDCSLRDGLGCCEGCGPIAEQLVAVRTDSEAALKQAMCEPNSACSKCMIQYPPNATALCNAGRCQVVLAK
ncbi:MAG: hypothetical protein AMXMBFR56_20830 [Polyangiaceae bacterium]